MFKESGKNVKGLARVMVLLSTLIGLGIGFYFSSEARGDGAIIYIIIGLVIGLIVGWLYALTIYCIGDIWEKVDRMQREQLMSGSSNIAKDDLP